MISNLGECLEMRILIYIILGLFGTHLLKHGRVVSQ